MFYKLSEIFIWIFYIKAGEGYCILLSQRNWMRPSIRLAVFTAVVRKGSIGQHGCSGNGLYSGYGTGLEGPQLEWH